MKIKFYVIHCDSSIHTCFVISKHPGISSYLLGPKTSKHLADNSRIQLINSYGFYLLLNELECCPTYHRAVARNIKSSTAAFVIQLIPNKKEFIDKTW